MTVPILFVLGQRDPIFCAADAVDCSTPDVACRQPSTVYPNAAIVAVDLVPRTGHFLNLHLTAPETYRAIGEWIRVLPL